MTHALTIAVATTLTKNVMYGTDSICTVSQFKCAPSLINEKTYHPCSNNMIFCVVLSSEMCFSNSEKHLQQEVSWLRGWRSSPRLPGGRAWGLLLMIYRRLKAWLELRNGERTWQASHTAKKLAEDTASLKVQVPWPCLQITCISLATAKRPIWNRIWTHRRLAELWRVQ